MQKWAEEDGELQCVRHYLQVTLHQDPHIYM